MYPHLTLNEFFPPPLRSLMGMIVSRTTPDVGESCPFWNTVLRRYTLFDLTTRLPELVRNDLNVIRYLQWCVEKFEERNIIRIFPREDHERLHSEIAQLKAYLAQRGRTALRPARL